MPSIMPWAKVWACCRRRSTSRSSEMSWATPRAAMQTPFSMTGSPTIRSQIFCPSPRFTRPSRWKRWPLLTAAHSWLPKAWASSRLQVGRAVSTQT